MMMYANCELTSLNLLKLTTNEKSKISIRMVIDLVAILL